MAINYNVRADVIDIRTDTPRKEDVFIVDSNAWYWHTYSRASMRVNAPNPYQITFYPSYLDKAIEVGATIYHSTHTLVELCSVIEAAESEIYEHQMGLMGRNRDFSVKEFRHLNDQAIATYRAEIDAVWSQIVGMSSPLSQTLDDSLSKQFSSSLQVERLDGYDTLLLLMARQHNIVRVITDDGDFSTVAGLVVHTANDRVVSAATRKGKLLPARRQIEAEACA